MRWPDKSFGRSSQRKEVFLISPILLQLSLSPMSDAANANQGTSLPAGDFLAALQTAVQGGVGEANLSQSIQNMGPLPNPMAVENSPIQAQVLPLPYPAATSMQPDASMISTVTENSTGGEPPAPGSTEKTPDETEPAEASPENLVAALPWFPPAQNFAVEPSQTAAGLPADATAAVSQPLTGPVEAWTPRVRCAEHNAHSHHRSTATGRLYTPGIHTGR